MPEQPGQDERTEQATPRKREEARKHGQVARSQELNSVFIIFTGLLALFIFSNYILAGFNEAFHFNFGKIGTDITVDNFYSLFIDNGWLLMKILAPILLLLGIVGVLINVAQVGFMITAEPITPKFDKLDVAKGLKRIFSVRTLVNLARDTIKILVIAYVAYLTYKGEMPNYIPLADQSVGQILVFMAKISLKIMLRVAGVLLILAILDYAYQRYEHEKQLKMSKQEIKDEMKQHEGDPLIKIRIRRIQRQMARARMLQEVPKADVVITNPTHLAVALKYDSETMTAPVVIAKGQRLIAEKIKEIAKEAGVPIVENKPLAQALFKSVEIGMEIPGKLFKAVAEVLAYVYKLKGKV